MRWTTTSARPCSAPSRRGWPSRAHCGLHPGKRPCGGAGDHKWDAVDDYQRQTVQRSIETRLAFRRVDQLARAAGLASGDRGRCCSTDLILPAQAIPSGDLCRRASGPRRPVGQGGGAGIRRPGAVLLHRLDPAGTSDPDDLPQLSRAAAAGSQRRRRCQSAATLRASSGATARWSSVHGPPRSAATVTCGGGRVPAASSVPVGSNASGQFGSHCRMSHAPCRLAGSANQYCTQLKSYRLYGRDAVLMAAIARYMISQDVPCPMSPCWLSKPVLYATEIVSSLWTRRCLDACRPASPRLRPGLAIRHGGPDACPDPLRPGAAGLAIRHGGPMPCRPASPRLRPGLAIRHGGPDACPDPLRPGAAGRTTDAAAGRTPVPAGHIFNLGPRGWLPRKRSRRLLA